MLHSINTGILIASLAVMGYIGWNVYSQYRVATGSTFQRLLAAARNSATLLWGKFVVFVSLIVGNLDTIATQLGAPEVSTFINTYIGNPKIIAAIMLGISLTSMAARLRTL